MFRSMTKLACGFVGAALVLGVNTAAHAYTVYLSDIAPTSVAPAVATPINATVGATGTLYIYINALPENYTFANGSLGVSLNSSDDSVIKFTSAEVYAPQFVGGFVNRWSGTQVQLSSSGSDVEILKGVSVNTAGLTAAAGAPTNGQPNTDANNAGINYAYAAVNYEVTGIGATTLQLGVITAQAGQFLVSGGNNVADDATFGSATVIGLDVPEPASLGLLGLSGLAAFARRRRAA